MLRYVIPAQYYVPYRACIDSYSDCWLIFGSYWGRSALAHFPKPTLVWNLSRNVTHISPMRCFIYGATPTTTHNSVRHLRATSPQVYFVLFLKCYELLWLVLVNVACAVVSRTRSPAQWSRFFWLGTRAHFQVLWIADEKIGNFNEIWINTRRVRSLKLYDKTLVGKTPAATQLMLVGFVRMLKSKWEIIYI